MKTLYLECRMGASGDMLLAALSELLPNPDAIVEMMNSLSLPGVEISREYRSSAGIQGAHMTVRVNGHEEESEDAHGHSHGHGRTHSHRHTSMEEIEAIIASLPVSPKVKQDALAVYSLIAGAESLAHGKPVSQIHFHEVGMLDAIADIVGVCMLMELLMKNGALDVFITPVQMKKSRPGFLLTVIASTADADRLTKLILRHTTTLGVRRKTCTRTRMTQRIETRRTHWGPVHYKVSCGQGIKRGKVEFSELARLADEYDLSLRQVLEGLKDI